MQVFPRGGLKTFRPLLVLAVVGLAGCGGAGSISGKVSYNGAVVKGGNISVIDAEGKSFSSPINEDGTYKIDKVAPGDATFMVETKSILAASKVMINKPPPGQQVPGAPPPVDPEDAKKRYLAIPDKYEDPKTTDLKYTVKSGSQTYDPPLK